MAKISKNPLKIGKNVFIRTLSMYYTGKIEELDEDTLVLTDAAWIPDTGRFGEALRSCKFNEVEPYLNPVAVNRSHILDVTAIESLPHEAK